MTVYRRHRHDKSFLAVDNATIRDQRLSFRARGLLVFLLSQPATFTVSMDELADQTVEGRDALRAAMRELESAKYVRRWREQDDLGRWNSRVDVFERPVSDDWKPVVGVTSGNTALSLVAPTTGKPAVGKPGAKDLRRTTKDRKDVPFAVAEDPATASWGDLDDVRQLLLKLQAPAELLDEPFWRKVDTLTDGTKVFYDRELRRYLAWLAEQPRSRRHKNARRGYMTWLQKAIAIEGWRNNAERNRRR